ncbi:class II glutamine amidotransferase [Fulvivirgaceae bacterium PWU4]|uniref:Class II glutamine amidotransferase n=1 Tax=Chryseosolibacter histidini TaxID=2782349 RepID=A0AAP2GI88_9BACT|nr:class II glutamine amidotransferase [Chryseosolibacter histidini]MBT1696891.1 class II glutamine amidotransferase [Chryseosolibacter histidini]
MCRLMAYLGSPIIIDKLLYQPKNSLVNQSINAKELEEPLNGDGFGLGWYAREVNFEPVTFVSVHPAWSNRNLRNLAPKIRTDCLIAHVRAASVGEVSESNCHPFQYKNMLMMHNGGVENFSNIKRKIREPLTDELYNWIKGQTDSEHIFAYLLNDLFRNHKTLSPEAVVDAFENTFKALKKMMAENNIHEAAYLNMVVTNGLFIVGTRYVTDPKEEPLTLYHSEGSRYVVEDGVTQMMAPEDDDQAVLVVSEKLSDDKDWTLIPPNHFVIVDNTLNVRIRAIKA